MGVQEKSLEATRQELYRQSVNAIEDSGEFEVKRKVKNTMVVAEGSKDLNPIAMILLAIGGGAFIFIYPALGIITLIILVIVFLMAKKNRVTVKISRKKDGMARISLDYHGARATAFSRRFMGDIGDDMGPGDTSKAEAAA